MLARLLGVRERTLRNWMRACLEEPKREGRPPKEPVVRWRQHLKVAREWKKQGRKTGWRTIADALAGLVPTRQVQESLKRLKANHRRRLRRRLKEGRETTTVLCSDAIWCQDATHLGRLDNRKAVEADVVKDRGSLQTLGLSVGSSASGEDVILLLKTIKEKRGGLPLVLQTDNGSAYCSDEVARLLAQEKVVHLRSRVRQPTDNGAAERGIGELKAEAGLGRGVHLRHGHQAGLLLAATAVKLNQYRLRGSKGYRTANEMAENLPSWYNRINRDRFYREAGEAIRKAEEGNGKCRARQAVNKAVLSLMAMHGLVRLTRGGQPIYGA